MNKSSNVEVHFQPTGEAEFQIELQTTLIRNAPQIPLEKFWELTDLDLGVESATTSLRELSDIEKAGFFVRMGNLGSELDEKTEDARMAYEGDYALSDDVWMDLRADIILRGKKSFEEVCSKPTTISEYIQWEPELTLQENMWEIFCTTSPESCIEGLSMLGVKPVHVPPWISDRAWTTVYSSTHGIGVVTQIDELHYVFKDRTVWVANPNS